MADKLCGIGESIGRVNREGGGEIERQTDRDKARERERKDGEEKRKQERCIQKEKRETERGKEREKFLDLTK